MVALIVLAVWLLLVALFFRFVWPRWADRMAEQHEAAIVAAQWADYETAIRIVGREMVEEAYGREASRIIRLADYDAHAFALDADEYNAAADGRRSA